MEDFTYIDYDYLVIKPKDIEKSGIVVGGCTFRCVETYPKEDNKKVFTAKYERDGSIFIRYLSNELWVDKLIRRVKYSIDKNEPLGIFLNIDNHKSPVSLEIKRNLHKDLVRFVMTGGGKRCEKYMSTIQYDTNHNQFKGENILPILFKSQFFIAEWRRSYQGNFYDYTFE